MYASPLLAVPSILLNSSDPSLPMDIWYPFSVTFEDTMGFYVAYAQQLILVIYTNIIEIAVNTFFVVILLRLNSQLDILKIRIQELDKFSLCVENKIEIINYSSKLSQHLISRCVRCHTQIYR